MKINDSGDGLGGGFGVEPAHSYQRAMRACPRTREAELEAIDRCISDATVNSLETNARVLELGAGAGFLTDHLRAEGFIVDTLDSQGWKSRNRAPTYVGDLRTGLPTEVPSGAYDVVVSLATMHHVIREDGLFPTPLLHGIGRVCKPDAVVVILDVPSSEDSARCQEAQLQRRAFCTNRFFTEVVDRYSVPPHKGVYVESSIVLRQIEAIGWHLESSDIHSCDWAFNSTRQAVWFLRRLFRIPAEHNRRIENHVNNNSYTRGDDTMLQWALNSISISLR